MLFSALTLLLAAPAAAQAPEAPPAPAPYLASGPRQMFAKGVELFDRGAVQEAATIFRALTLAYPDLPEPHINLAVLLAVGGGTEESAAEVEAAIRAHPLCRAAYDLEFQRQIGPYSTTLLSAGAPPAAQSPARPAAPLTPAPGPALRAEIDGEVRVVLGAADPCLNFRPEPSASAAALECLPPGSRVQWLETAGDWSRVVLRDGREGWMAASFLTPPQP